MVRIFRSWAQAPVALSTHRDCDLISLAPLTCACCADSRFLALSSSDCSGGSKLIVSSIGRQQGQGRRASTKSCSGPSWTHQTMRDLSSTVWDTLLIKASSPEADSMQKQTETQAEKGAARGARTHSRPTIRLGLPRPDQVSPAEGQRSGNANSTRALDFCARLEFPLPNQICDEVRFCRLDKTYKADVKRVTLNIVSPQKRLLVLEALGQTDAERKYGRAPPTAMVRE